MSKILNTLSAVGALVMAATPLAAIGAAAHAADYTPVRIQVSDLDFSQRADVARFHQRVKAVADRMCGAGPDLSRTSACEQAVLEEATERLGSAQREDMKTAEAPTAWRVASQ